MVKRLTIGVIGLQGSVSEHVKSMKKALDEANIGGQVVIIKNKNSPIYNLPWPKRIENADKYRANERNSSNNKCTLKYGWNNEKLIFHHIMWNYHL